MRAFSATLAAMLLIVSPTSATAQAPAGPILIEGNILLDIHFRRFGTEGNSSVRIDFYMTMTGDRLEGAYSRNVVAKDGRVIHAENNKVSAVINKVLEAKNDPGYGVAILSGNTLTVLKTAKVGANKIVVTMGRSSGCGIRFEQLRETGKGNVQRKSIDTGGDIEVISARKVSSICRLTRS
jgi:hypothetical protein